MTGADRATPTPMYCDWSVKNDRNRMNSLLHRYRTRGDATEQNAVDNPLKAELSHVTLCHPGLTYIFISDVRAL